MSAHITEAKRQIEICNACRYCEGYCAVFPAITREKHFAAGDITQLANLCHNCRGCYYACQYTEPHEFAINLPKALAEVRQESWQDFAYPKIMGEIFHKYGLASSALAILLFSLFFLLIYLLPETSGAGFYKHLSHSVMVAIFIPAFLLPLIGIAVSLRRYWKAVGGRWITIHHLKQACIHIATMKQLDGGQGQGCNFEKEDIYSNNRRWAHQVTLYGFFLCFLSTSVATLMHYAFGLEAPYPLFSLPKLFGLSGGVMLCFGTVWLGVLKIKADKNLQSPTHWGGDMGFIFLLFMVSFTGLILYGIGATPILLSLHLGCVMALFCLMPYSKMAHGFYRMAALVRNAQS